MQSSHYRPEIDGLRSLLKKPHSPLRYFAGLTGSKFLYHTLLACYEKSDPSVMKVFSPFGKETIDEYEEAEATQSGADRGEAA